MLRHLNQRAASLVGRTATSMLMRTRTVSNKTRRAPKPINTVINFVPQQQAWVIESMGKYSRVLNPGVNVIVPVIENIAYVHSLKENAIVLPSQTAITRDNVILHIDGVLYMQIVDPHKASYGVEDAEYAVKQLAMTTMRSEIGYMTLDEVFKERAKLNHNIVQVINDASSAWGVVSKRCETSDVQLSDKVVDAMQMQVSAERKKRARVLESEGMREAVVNQATGEAEAILKRATATAAGIKQVACAIEAEGGHSAVSMNVAEQYVQAFGKLAKTNNTILLPAATGDVASMVTQAMSIFKNIRPHTTDSDAHPTSSSSSPSATTLSTTTPLEDSVNVDVSADAEFEEALARAKRIPGTD